MKDTSAWRRPITAAQRGHIVQRVIVDGWTSAEAAASFGVSERAVNAWVADYRRHGMTSLRRAPDKTIAAMFVQLLVLQPAQAALRRVAIGLRRVFARENCTLQPVPLCRSNTDNRGSRSPIGH
jgi:transposase-like protein